MKTCSQPECIWPVFSHNFCKRHQYLRTDLKKPESKSFGIAKRSPRKPLRPRLDFGFESQPDLFAYKWENAKNEKGQVICPYTGINLGRYLYPAHPELWLNCFAHLLPKKNYPYFRLCPGNIRVVYPEFHTIVDQGTSEDRKKHPEWRFSLWDSEVEAYKKAYLVYKKNNLLA